MRPFPIASDVTIPVGGYDFQDVFASYSMGAQRRFSGTFSVQRGEFFSGHITTVSYRRGRIEITPQFSFEPSISLNRIDLPEGQFTTTLVQSRVTYTLTPRMFFGGLLQYSNSTNSLSANLRLRWEYISRGASCSSSTTTSATRRCGARPSSRTAPLSSSSRGCFGSDARSPSAPPPPGFQALLRRMHFPETAANS